MLYLGGYRSGLEQRGCPSPLRHDRRCYQPGRDLPAGVEVDIDACLTHTHSLTQVINSIIIVTGRRQRTSWSGLSAAAQQGSKTFTGQRRHLQRAIKKAQVPSTKEPVGLTTRTTEDRTKST